MKPIPSVVQCFLEIRNPIVYKNFLIHLFVMIPAAALMAWMGHTIDGILGLPTFIGQPWNWIVAIALFLVGGVVVVYTYGYLAILGEGSPGTHVDGGPIRIVVTGPYTVVRHPSVIGKLLGVIGLGVLSRSTVFTFVIIPLLLVYSLVTNRYLQERYCETKFGAVYDRYRAVVPMVLPRPSGLLRWVRGEPAIALEEEP